MNNTTSRMMISRSGKNHVRRYLEGWEGRRTQARLEEQDLRPARPTAIGPGRISSVPSMSLPTKKDPGKKNMLSRNEPMSASFGGLQDPGTNRKR